MQLRHPRLVAVLDVVDDPTGLAIASEYVDGELLRLLMHTAAIKRAPLPVPVAVRITLDVVGALRAARDLWTKSTPLTGPEPERLLRCVYGGLTPESIVVASYGDTILADVGVAGMASTIEAVGRRPGLLPYRAPEQLRDGTIIDERTDVFSLGIVLWEMLANRPLFGSERRLLSSTVAVTEPGEAGELAERVLHAEIPRLDAVGRPGAPIPTKVVDLVARALERDVEGRHQTLEELERALKALPREQVATPEQVVMTVDRIAREAIDARRAALELTAGYRVASDSKPPPSNRPTPRPPAPKQVERIVNDARVHIPKAARLPSDALRLPTPPPRVESGERPLTGFADMDGPTGRLDVAELKRRGVAPPAPWRPQRGGAPSAMRSPPAIPAKPSAAAAAEPQPRELAGDKPQTVDAAIDAARALFKSAPDDFSNLPLEPGADGIPPPPATLTRSSAPPRPETPNAAFPMAPPADIAPGSPEASVESTDADAGAAISVVTAEPQPGKRRWVALGIAAVVIAGVGAALALTMRSAEPVTTPAVSEQRAKAESPRQPAQPTEAPTPEPATPAEAAEPSEPASAAENEAESAEDEALEPEAQPEEPERDEPAAERPSQRPAAPGSGGAARKSKRGDAFRPSGI
jgi:serine/threonine-protein kinase